MDDSLSKKSIGMRIKNLRIQHNISQETIAKKIGMSRSNYSQIELGNQYPSFAALYFISSYYKKSYDWIIHGDAQGPRSQTVNEIDSSIQTIELAVSELKESLKNAEVKLTDAKISGPGRFNDKLH